MDVDYERLSKAVAATVRALEEGSKQPMRRPRVQIRVVRDLQGEVTAGPFCFRADAARRWRFWRARAPHGLPTRGTCELPADVVFGSRVSTTRS